MLSIINYLFEGKFWIQEAIKKKGALHKQLGVPEGEKIPKSELKVKESDSPLLKKRKTLALTLSKMKK